MTEHVPLVDRVPERLRERPTWLISRAYARATGLLQEGFTQAGGGLRSYHYRLLAALDEWGPASQATLGRGTGIDRSDVTAALTDLEERGLVRRDVNQADRRRNVVSITAAGVSHLERLDSVVDEIQERLLAPLSEGERRQFMTLMHRIVAADLDIRTTDAPPIRTPVCFRGSAERRQRCPHTSIPDYRAIRSRLSRLNLLAPDQLEAGMSWLAGYDATVFER